MKYEIDDVERGAELNFSVARLCQKSSSNFGFRQYRQDGQDGRTDGRTDGRNKHIVGLPCSEKLSSDYLPNGAEKIDISFSSDFTK